MSQTPMDARPGFISRHRTTISVAIHIFLFAVSLLSAFGLAYNFTNLNRWVIPLFVPLLGLALPIKIVVFWLTGQYRGSWRYVGLRDLFGVVRASYISAFVFVLGYFAIENIWALTHARQSLFDPGRNFAQSVFLLDVAATIALVCAARVAVRFYYEEVRAVPGEYTIRALIVGAGDSGEALLRELLRMPSAHYEVVGFVDDEASSRHARIHGVDVLGRIDELCSICEREDVEEIFIALARSGPREMRRVVELCEGMNIRFRTVPPAIDLIEGRVQVSQFRDVAIEDLLGRDPVELDTQAIGAQLAGKRIVITGAGGSIGSEMCRQIARFGPERLILIEQAENNLFEIDRELRASFQELDIVPYVVDICDAARVRRVLADEQPAALFHAAAHKHVPMMELNPGEAVKNNVVGSMTVADAVVAAGVAKMVMISTDKAVNPTSIMGCSKRVAEMYVSQVSARCDGTQFVTVRFGNVLGSSGSVIPIFKQQIARGGPVTVTHPDMTRYFMTIPEAAQLVLQAGTMGHGGEVYVLDMGEPVRIRDLARDMITLSGLRPGTDIEIVYSGVRPGEKLFEELMIEGEDVSPTKHPKIGIWQHRTEDWDRLCAGIKQLRELADADDRHGTEIRKQLASMVPEYVADPHGADRRRQEAETEVSEASAPDLSEPSTDPAFGV